jgi:hypothetical protein
MTIWDDGLATYEADYDFACAVDEDVLEAVFKHGGLVITGYQREGPGGGNPVLTLRGTVEAHAQWFRFYDPDADDMPPLTQVQP